MSLRHLTLSRMEHLTVSPSGNFTLLPIPQNCDLGSLLALLPHTQPLARSCLLSNIPLSLLSLQPHTLSVYWSFLALITVTSSLAFPLLFPVVYQKCCCRRPLCVLLLFELHHSLCWLTVSDLHTSSSVPYMGEAASDPLDVFISSPRPMQVLQNLNFHFKKNFFGCQGNLNGT